MQQIMHKILQLYPLIQSKLKEGMEEGLGMCKVVVEFATVNRCLLLRGGEGGEGERTEGDDATGSQSQEEALEMMQLVLVRGGEGEGKGGAGRGGGEGEGGGGERGVV